MAVSNKYNIFVGTTRGTIISTHCLENEKLHFTASPEASEITALDWLQQKTERTSLLVGFKNGHGAKYCCGSHNYDNLYTELKGKGPVVGVFNINETYFFGRHNGIVNVMRNDSACDVISLQSNFNADSTMERLCWNSTENWLATGGECNDFKLWDIEKQKCIFKGKSLGHDELNLRIGATVQAILFLDGKLGCVATKQGHILLYDSRGSQRKPVWKFVEPKASYRCAAPVHCRSDRQLVVGTGRGYLQLLDVKAPKACVRTFQGYTGSITDVECDPHQPLAITVSLDRHLRVHNLSLEDNVKSQHTLFRTYMKQSLCKLAVRILVKEEQQNSTSKRVSSENSYEEIIAQSNLNETEDDDDFDRIFDSLEVITDRCKRKASSNSSPLKKKKIR